MQFPKEIYGSVSEPYETGKAGRNKEREMRNKMKDSRFVR